MSENDSQRPQDAGHAGETQQQPRVQVESTPADGNIPYVQAYDTQTGKPLGGQQVVNKHTVVKTKTKKLPIFITALAGCACCALLVIALIMSGTLDIGGGRNAVTAGFGFIDAKDHHRFRGHHAGRGRLCQGAALRCFHHCHFERQPEWLAFAVC